MKYIKPFNEGAFDNADIVDHSSEDAKNILTDVFNNMTSRGDGSYVSYASFITSGRDMDEDWERMQELIEQKGLPLNDIKTIADANNAFYEDLTMWCGYSDLLMYKLYDSTDYLYGMTLNEWFEMDEEYEDDKNETLKLKYNYGWHNNKYGQLVLERDLGSVNNFLEMYNDKVVNPKTESKDIRVIVEGITVDIDVLTPHIDEILNLVKFKALIQNFNSPTTNIESIEGDISSNRDFTISIFFEGDIHFSLLGTKSSYEIAYEQLSMTNQHELSQYIDETGSMDYPIERLLELLFKQLHRMYGEPL